MIILRYEEDLRPYGPPYTPLTHPLFFVDIKGVIIRQPPHKTKYYHPTHKNILIV